MRPIKNINVAYLKDSAVYSATSSILIAVFFTAGFLMAEPKVGFGQAATEEFIISQVITDETSFLVPPPDITMSGSISGTTGGNATGTTQFTVQTNNSAGYTVEISFPSNGTPHAMTGDFSGSESLRNYDDNAGTPSDGFTVSTSAQFAYTVTSSSSANTADPFLNGGGLCGAGSTQTPEYCWKAPQVAGYTIVDTDGPALTGATSTLQFRVHVPNTPVPALPAESYTATATLSVFVK